MIPLILVLFAVVCCVCAQFVRERYLREIRREERIAEWDQFVRMHRSGQAERVTLPRDAWHNFEGYHQAGPGSYITTRARPCVVPACLRTTCNPSGICLMHPWSPERVRDTGTE